MLEPRGVVLVIEIVDYVSVGEEFEGPQPIFRPEENPLVSVVQEFNLLTIQAVHSGVAITRCGCPIAEKSPEGLSGTFCQCSVGFVRAMFSGYLGKPVRVELLEALKHGGKTCRFKIMLA